MDGEQPRLTKRAGVSSERDPTELFDFYRRTREQPALLLRVTVPGHTLSIETHADLASVAVIEDRGGCSAAGVVLRGDDLKQVADALAAASAGLRRKMQP